MDAPMLTRSFDPARLGIGMQTPVARFPVVDAAAGQLRKSLEHCLTGCRDQKRPSNQLLVGELTTFPDLSRWIDDEVPAVAAVDENEIRHEK